MRPRARAAFFGTILFTAACATSSSAAVEDISFDPNLAVDLSAMDRTAMGLYVQDLIPGEGTEVRPGHRVRIYYAGWLPDGVLIDGTAPPEEPMEFRVGEREVIRGLDDGVRGMRPGGQRRLVVPPELGYGSRPPAPVPPNAVLVFVVELAEVL